MRTNNIAEITKNVYRDFNEVSEEILCHIVETSLKHPDHSKSNIFKNINLSCYEDIAELDNNILAEIIDGIYAGDKDLIDMNIYFWNEGVAPSGMITQDFDSALKDFSLFWGKSSKNERDFLIRAIPGHAQSSHCMFREFNSCFPNTMAVDVVNALAEFPKKYRLKDFKQFSTDTQKEINDIVYFLENFFIPGNKDIGYAINGKKKALSNMNILKNYPFNILEALRGFYFASHMDNYDNVRKPVGEKYNYNMGGGSCYPVDVDALKKYNISLNELSEGEYSIPFLTYMDPEKRIKLFERMGIVTSSEIFLDNIDSLCWDEILERGVNINKVKGDIRNIYIRSERGPGLADDIAIFLSAFIPQTFTNNNHFDKKIDPMSRFMFSYLGDKIDTLEKDASIILPGGQDEVAGRYLNLKFKQFCSSYKNRRQFNIKPRGDYDLVSSSVLMDFTIASAITKHDIHSSQRYFQRSMECKQLFRKTCALKENMRNVYLNAYSRGIDMKPIIKRLDYADPIINIGFTHIPLKIVQNVMNERLDLVFLPNLREKNLRDFYN